MPVFSPAPPDVTRLIRQLDNSTHWKSILHYCMTCQDRAFIVFKGKRLPGIVGYPIHPFAISPDIQSIRGVSKTAFSFVPPRFHEAITSNQNARSMQRSILQTRFGVINRPKSAQNQSSNRVPVCIDAYWFILPTFDYILYRIPTMNAGFWLVKREVCKSDIHLCWKWYTPGASL